MKIKNLFWTIKKEISLFGEDNDTTYAVLINLSETMPYSEIINEINEILYCGKQEVSNRLEQFLIDNKESIMQYINFIKFCDDEKEV